MAQPDDPQTEPPPTARHRHFFSRLLDRAHQRGRSESVPPKAFTGSQTAPQLQSPEETTSQDQNHDPVKGAGTAPRRVSRSVVPGLPRVKTFKRQLSEDRDRLAPVEPTPEERRAVSMDRRSHAFHTRHQGQTDPRASAPDNISSAAANHESAPFSSSTLAQDTTDLDSQSPGREPFGDDLQRTEAMTEDGSIAPIEFDEFDRMLRYELETTWILNLSMRYKDRSNREKFFVTYRESEQLWRRVTVTLDYRNAPEGSLEEELLGMKYQRDKSSKIYESIRQSLPEIQFYDTVTNLKLETTDDRLHVHVVEDGNETFDYPSVQQVAHLGCKLVRERELLFDHHMSGFVYKVSIDNQPLIKKEIPGPQTVEEFLYEINALSSLTYSDHVIEFYGLVVDDERECVKGLLISYANGGALADIIYDSCKERRQGLAQFLKERWAKQIIRGLADVHESGFVQGDFTLSNIVIDEYENAKIIDINRRGCPVGWEPPEATALIESNQRITMYIGVKSDLYQLGMVLWALAMDEDEPDREGRPLILGDDVPIADWYRKVTNTCLSPDPRTRLQASLLVQLLPDDPVPATNLAPADDALHATPQQEYHPDGRPRIKVNDLNGRWFSPDRSNGPSDSRGYHAWQHYAPRGRSPPSPMPSNVDCGSKSPRRFHTESAWAANRNIRPCYSDIGADEVVQQLTPSTSGEMPTFLLPQEMDGMAGWMTDNQLLGSADATPLPNKGRSFDDEVASEVGAHDIQDPEHLKEDATPSASHLESPAAEDDEATTPKVHGPATDAVEDPLDNEAGLVEKAVELCQDAAETVEPGTASLAVRQEPAEPVTTSPEPPAVAAEAGTDGSIPDPSERLADNAALLGVAQLGEKILAGKTSSGSDSADESAAVVEKGEIEDDAVVKDDEPALTDIRTAADVVDADVRPKTAVEEPSEAPEAPEGEQPSSSVDEEAAHGNEVDSKNGATEAGSTVDSTEEPSNLSMPEPNYEFSTTPRISPCEQQDGLDFRAGDLTPEKDPMRAKEYDGGFHIVSRQEALLTTDGQA